jgi:hypothetical protein
LQCCFFSLLQSPPDYCWPKTGQQSRKSKGWRRLAHSTLLAAASANQSGQGGRAGDRRQCAIALLVQNGRALTSPWIKPPSPGSIFHSFEAQSFQCVAARRYWVRQWAAAVVMVLPNRLPVCVVSAEPWTSSSADSRPTVACLRHSVNTARGLRLDRVRLANDDDDGLPHTIIASADAPIHTTFNHSPPSQKSTHHLPSPRPRLSPPLSHPPLRVCSCELSPARAEYQPLSIIARLSQKFVFQRTEPEASRT